jgi:hypothetical protein
VGSALDDVDRDLVADNARERAEQIFIEKIEQLSSKFDTGWTTTTNDKGQQASALFIGGGRKTGLLHVLQHLVLDATSIVNRLQEVTILEALDTMRIRHTA